MSSFEESQEGECKYYSLLLEQAFRSRGFSRARQVIDVGCRNWSYVDALARFFPSAKLRGIEVDGGRRFIDLYRRMDYSEAYAKRLNESEYRDVQMIHADFREFSELDFGSEVVFSFLFPFVSKKPCFMWGLPDEFADFRELIQHALNISKAKECKPTLISAHQGEVEGDLARKIYLEYNFEVKESVVPRSIFGAFWPSPHDTIVFLVSPKQ